MSIEGIALEHFSALPNDDINSTTPSRQNHAVFQSSSDDIKKYAATTSAHSKRLIALF